MIHAWIDGFIRDCRSCDLSPHTVQYYRVALAQFEKYCQACNMSQISDIMPDLISGQMQTLRRHLQDAQKYPRS
jgi:hypothetical protein